MDSDDNLLLKAIHSMKATAVVFRQPFIHSSFKHQGYLVNAQTSNIFADNFKKLRQEPTWNPAARFLIVIKILKEDELKKIFDVLLESHVFNSLLINATDEAQIYTYNPFDKYACGHYYSDVICYGECSQTKIDLYPNKLVTGLKNCSFRATAPHRAPFAINKDRLDKNTETYTLGTEQLVLHLLSEKEQFKVNYSYDYDNLKFSTISPNMTVSGPMKILTNNESDIIFGGIWLVASRSDAFTYLYGHLDFEDDLIIIVKRASLVAIWKTAFLGFQPTVWGLLVMTFLLYSVMMIRILGADDKFGVVMKLFKNLLANSVHIPTRSEVKGILIGWIWFSYLINSIYQSSLVSLTSHPAKEHQVHKIREIFVYKMKPCINPSMLIYIETEMNYILLWTG
ncbi:ionotropic receptor 21a-like [Helicoverpa armigera]|uniref:ionotropic receptor 21a-like n=1 Tax=Helicoverpa armigera TaxID=29058 RepID=UPI003082ADCE